MKSKAIFSWEKHWISTHPKGEELFVGHMRTPKFSNSIQTLSSTGLSTGLGKTIKF